MPLEKCLVVTESNPTIIQTNIHQPRGVKMMTIVQLRKNLSHDESTLAAIVVFEKGSSSVPTSTKTLLPLHEHHDPKQEGRILGFNPTKRDKSQD